MSDPTPAPAPIPASAFNMYDQIKTIVLGIALGIVIANHSLTPSPTPPAPTPIPVPVPVPPSPVPVPVPPAPNPTPVPPPAPVVTDFFSIGKAYRQALGAGYADAWDANFQIKPGDDLDAKLAAVKSAWDAARTSAFGASVAPALESIAPDRKAVDQTAADALNKARTDFATGLRTPG
jgi:hypothetical protein